MHVVMFERFIAIYPNTSPDVMAYFCIQNSYQNFWIFSVIFISASVATLGLETLDQHGRKRHIVVLNSTLTWIVLITMLEKYGR